MESLYEPGHVLLKVMGVLRGYLRRVRDALWLSSVDVLFVYREAAFLVPPLIEQLLALRRPLVFDFDDAIYLGDSSQANAWTRKFKRCSKTAMICRLARRVTVGNEVLAEFARNHTEAVTVVPSTVDTDFYRIRPRSRNRVPVIGWTGSATTAPHLSVLAGALRRLREKCEYELRVIGAEIAMEGLTVDCRPWRADNEPDDLCAFDIGLMPIPDNDWSRGKCGMKALQYMALGIPPIVSPVGVNTKIVHDGVNGFHARTEDEWVDRMTLLLRDASLRHALGEEARRTVENNYSARIHAPRMAAVLREAGG
jgi:glycosyltransferase involved in cell wall biosynthesis